MKNSKVIEIENKIRAALSGQKNWSLVKHLNKNLALVHAVAVTLDVEVPATVKAYQRELGEMANEINAMEPAARLAALKELRDKHPNAKADALEWGKMNSDRLEDTSEIEFFSAPDSVARKGTDLLIDALVFADLCDAKIFTVEGD